MAGCSPVGRNPISPHTPTVIAVDVEDMGGEHEGSTVPPAARAFLERHRLAQDNLGSARRDADHEKRDDDDGEDDDEARDQRGDDGELEVDGHRVDGRAELVLGPSPEGLGSQSSIGPHNGSDPEARTGAACELRAVVSTLRPSECPHAETSTCGW